MLIFFFPELSSLPSMTIENNPFAIFTNPFQVLFIGFCGVNFIGEFLVSLVLSPAIIRIVDIIKNKSKI